MKLFSMKDWKLTLDDEVWGLAPFKKLLERDKTKEKEQANAEMLYIWFYADIKSDYLFIPENERGIEIVKNIPTLKNGWKPDEVVKKAIKFYRNMSETTIQKLYKNSLKAAQDVGDYLSHADILLKERDVNGRPIYDVKKITNSLKDVKTIMKNLKEAEKEVIKEQKDNEGRTKGKQEFNLFEDGL